MKLTDGANNPLVQFHETATVNQVLIKTTNIYGNQGALSEKLQEFVLPHLKRNYSYIYLSENY